jgi:membrane protein CcdC involved in cytochrome C biogenesis
LKGGKATMPLAFIPVLVALVVLCGSFVYSYWLKKRAMRETKETAGSPTVKRPTKSKAFIIILNSLLLIVFIITAWAYKDVFNGADPLELMGLYILTIPALIVLGVILIVSKKRLHAPLFNGLIPFIGIVAFFSTLFLNGIAPSSYDWTRVGLTGVGIGVALSIVTAAITVAILVSKRNRV